VLKHEGGNDDDPQDPGGRTSRGITQREYTSWLGEPKDVWKATDKEVKAIYKTQYWDPWCDRLPDGVDYEAFDMFVNMGPVQGSRIIQRAVGVTADGHMGLVTLNAILGQSDKSAIIRQISDRRRAFYRSLRTFSHFGRGWLRRVDEVEQAALKMVVAEPIPQGIMSTDLPDTAPRASTEKADDRALNMTPETAGGASAGLGSVTTLMEHNYGGEVKILMTSGRKRVTVLRDVPTAVELGYPNLELMEWYGFFASSASPGPIVAKWNRQLRLALAEGEVIAALAQLGLDVEMSTQEESVARFGVHLKTWEARLQSFGMKTVD
ncbi:MAG: tripartite tricarboxylate transporter substrate-binding protein, partial [Enhydrobacter sp.]